MLPASPPSKKYVCKQTFDCCRECNHAFYTCISMAGYTYSACMRGAYKCMCDCIDQKSYSEVPNKLPTLPATNEPIATTAPRNPEYWYYNEALCERDYLNFNFLHVPYNNLIVLIISFDNNNNSLAIKTCRPYARAILLDVDRNFTILLFLIIFCLTII